MPIDCLNDNVPVYDPDDKGCYRWMSIKAGRPSKFCSDVTFEKGLELPPGTIIKYCNDELCFNPPLDIVGPDDAEFYPRPLVLTMDHSTIYSGSFNSDWNEVSEATREAVNYGRLFDAFPGGQAGQPQFGEVLWESDFGPPNVFPLFKEVNTYFRWTRAVSTPQAGDLFPGSPPYASFIYVGGYNGSPELPAPLNENPCLQPETVVRVTLPGQYRLTITVNYLNKLRTERNDVTIDGLGNPSSCWFRVMDFTGDFYNWETWGDLSTESFVGNLETTQTASFYINVTPEKLQERGGFIDLHTFLYYFANSTAWNESSGLKPPQSGVVILGTDRGLLGPPASNTERANPNLGGTSLSLEYVASSQDNTISGVNTGSASGLVGGGSQTFTLP